MSTPFEYAALVCCSIGWIVRDVALFLAAHWSGGPKMCQQDYVRKEGDSCVQGTVDWFHSSQPVNMLETFLEFPLPCRSGIKNGNFNQQMKVLD